MKRKKKDLNQHSWKVHILQFLTVGFALWSWWETAAGVKLTQKLPQDQTERWMAVLLITGFLGSVWLGTMLVKRKKLLLCIFCGFLSCTSDICGGFDVFPGSERMLASDDCSRIVCDSAYIDVL